MSSISKWLRIFGVDLRKGRTALLGIFRYVRERRCFKKDLGDEFLWGRSLAVLEERSASSGNLGAYFYQDLGVARWVYQANPIRHVDVGSRIDGFVGHLAVFREVEVLDIRPQSEKVAGLRFHQLDLMAPLPEDWTECTDSLSCLHTIEHFGLGRYNDPIDTTGHLKGMEQLKKMVAPGGWLYLSTPIGPQRIEFNAHRIFAASTLLNWFDEGWEIERFAVIDDNNEWLENPSRTAESIANHFGCFLGVGVVAARKLSADQYS